MITLAVPRDSSYKSGIFVLVVEFPDNYPESAPDIYFTTPIYYLNVNPYNIIGIKLGNVSLNFLNNWKLGYTRMVRWTIWTAVTTIHLPVLQWGCLLCNIQ